ncbi:MAG TPA: DUF167 domain-containing protein [Nitrospiraceae bacterium]|nr:DUF167 domain-containing protein [Nitrospiraceae bacterium]
MNKEFICDSARGAVLTVHVQPKAARTECVGPYGDALKVRVAAPPVEGAANEALIRFLAETCGIPSGSVEIRSGSTARRKQILLKGLSARSVVEKLRR